MAEFKDSHWSKREQSAHYLEYADIYLPERRRFLKALLSFHARFFGAKGKVRVLDLGCGDGFLTRGLLSAGRAISATLVDPSTDMLERARVKLNDFPDTTFINASFEELMSGATPLGPFDLAVSSLAIHHLTTNARADFFRYVQGLLDPGGWFINMDVVSPPSSELDEWYIKLWKESMIEGDRAEGPPDLDYDDFIEKYHDPEHQKNVDPLEVQLAAMKGAGFMDVDCFFKSGIFAMYGGRN